jgi:hypothetical protein
MSSDPSPRALAQRILFEKDLKLRLQIPDARGTVKSAETKIAAFEPLQTDSDLVLP